MTSKEKVEELFEIFSNCLHPVCCTSQDGDEFNDSVRKCVEECLVEMVDASLYTLRLFEKKDNAYLKAWKGIVNYASELEEEVENHK